MNGIDITSAVQAVMSNGNDYSAQGDVTHCSEFVRDFWAQLGFPASSDLAGQANDQVTALSSSAAWTTFSFAGVGDVPSQAGLNDADSAASTGQVVLLGWLNPNWTGSGDTSHHGHIAIVVPSAGDALQSSGTWPNLLLPFIAQAGPIISGLGGGSVFSKIKMSWGFWHRQETRNVAFYTTQLVFR